MTNRLQVALDTETELITFREPHPRMVCAQWAAGGGGAQPGPDVELVHHSEAGPTLEALISDPEIQVVGHNVAGFDLPVIARAHPPLLPRIFEALDHARVADTQIREQLLAIADGTFELRRKRKGSFSLGNLARERTGIALDKSEDSWRLRYGELRDVPVDQWPREARDYATADAATTLAVRRSQEGEAYGCPDEPLQVQSAFALSLMGACGVVTDDEAVDDFELRLLEEMAGHEEALVAAGCLRPDGSRNTKEIQARVEAAYQKKFGRPAPRTKGGKDPSSPRYRGPQVSTDADTIDEVADADPVLGAAQGWGTGQYYLSNYALKMRRGPYIPDDVPGSAAMRERLRDAPRYDAIRSDFRNLVESGRTSCGARKLKINGREEQHGLNWQNLSRDWDGGRECVVARPGNVLVCCDYSIAELRALAQVCYSWFGWSQLREAIAGGMDPHVLLASQLLGISYEEGAARKKAGEPELRLMRDNVAKHMNFGLAGGMGAEKFVHWVRGATGGKLRLDEHRAVEFGGRMIPSARELKAAWMRQWPEMRRYFKAIAETVDADGAIEQVGTKRRRGGVIFTDAANGYFQGYVADVAKRANYLVTRACYVEDPRYPALYGCRPILFIHDEIVLDAPEEQAPDAAAEMRQIMEEVEGKAMPDVPPEAEAKICRRWRKQAKPVHGPDGRLRVWEEPVQRAAA